MPPRFRSPGTARPCASGTTLTKNSSGRAISPPSASSERRSTAPARPDARTSGSTIAAERRAAAPRARSCGASVVDEQPRRALQLEAVGGDQPEEAQREQHELRAGHRGRRQRQPARVAGADGARRTAARATPPVRLNCSERERRVPRRARRHAVDAGAGGHAGDAEQRRSARRPATPPGSRSQSAPA